jgi:hypothetical protein
VNPEFFISPAFIVILAVTVALLTVAVLWLMRDGPSTRRAGMIDLTGVKPKGMTWDWPAAPLGPSEHPYLFGTAQSDIGAMPARMGDLRGPIETEPERRPSFGV